MTTLLLGIHRPTWLANPEADRLRPLFLSRNVFTDTSGLRLRRTLPVARADQNGDRPCQCGAAKKNARHQLPDAPPEHLTQQRRYDLQEGN